MSSASPASEIIAYTNALKWFVQNSGKIVPWPAPVDNIFLANKAKGIHKPAGLDYALSVRLSMNGPYEDSIKELSDGSWQLHYAQEGLDLKYFTNRALIACMRDAVPIGVMIQVSSKPRPLYKILGLGQVVDWKSRTFTIHQFTDNRCIAENIDPHQLENDFYSSDDRDARIRILRSIATRQGQKIFRNSLLEAYGGICSVSGCKVSAILEAAHILPYRGRHSNHVKNGLLLRADIHTLFDLGLLDIDPENFTIQFSQIINDENYTAYNGKSLKLPENKNNWPSKQVLHSRLIRQKLLS